MLENCNYHIYKNQYTYSTIVLFVLTHLRPFCNVIGDFKQNIYNVSFNLSLHHRAYLGISLCEVPTLGISLCEVPTLGISLFHFTLAMAIERERAKVFRCGLLQMILTSVEHVLEEKYFTSGHRKQTVSSTTWTLKYSTYLKITNWRWYLHVK